MTEDGGMVVSQATPFTQRGSRVQPSRDSDKMKAGLEEVESEASRLKSTPCNTKGAKARGKQGMKRKDSDGKVTAPCHLGARRRLQHLAFVHVSTIHASSLVPRPLPDFISQRDKIWGWPGDDATNVSQATLFLSLCEKGVACETKLHASLFSH